jgi:hypothetical protein
MLVSQYCIVIISNLYISAYPSGFDSYFIVETVKSGEYFRAIVKQVKQINMNQHNIFEIFLKVIKLFVYT